MSDAFGDTLDDFDQRLEAFQEYAQEVSGPLGALFQRIALAQQQYAAAAERHGTTVGECARLVGVVEAAMDAAEWLQSDDSEVQLVSMNLAEFIADIAAQTNPGDVLPGRPESPERGVA